MMYMYVYIYIIILYIYPGVYIVHIKIFPVL